LSLLLVDANVYDCFFSFIFFENHLEDRRVGGLGKMESKGYEDGWGARILFWLFVPTHLSTFCFKGTLEGNRQRKKLDWFCCDFNAWVPHSLFFLSYYWEGLFLYNNPAWGILSSAVGLRETGQGH
jgi:hypothetical protein